MTKKIINLIATPIGNTDDISMLAIDILKKTNFVICEDTRRIKYILNYYNIQNSIKFYVVNKFNENNLKNIENLSATIEESEFPCWVSDAGYPLICDPGFKVKKALQNQFSFNVVSGCSSIISALLLSGFPAYPFYFGGFLSNKTVSRQKDMNRIKNNFGDTTIILFESVHRIYKFLNDLYAVFGDIKICICREISKTHETITVDNISDIINNKEIVEKGEFVIVFKNE